MLSLKRPLYKFFMKSQKRFKDRVWRRSKSFGRSAAQGEAKRNGKVQTAQGKPSENGATSETDESIPRTRGKRLLWRWKNCKKVLKNSTWNFTGSSLVKVTFQYYVRTRRRSSGEKRDHKKHDRRSRSRSRDRKRPRSRERSRRERSRSREKKEMPAGYGLINPKGTKSSRSDKDQKYESKFSAFKNVPHSKHDRKHK